jgi:NADPH:quinone reductase-like Zn-dependent oxidoreductase
MTGRPYLGRVAGIGLRRPTNPVPGLDLAGTVVAVGAGVTRVTPGDEVFGIGRGSFAQLAAARAEKLAPKPTGLTFAQAAAVPVSGLTALQALRDAGRVEAGQEVLIIGASGGVGSYAVQIAAASGARVTGVCAVAKADLVRALGAERVIDHEREDFAESGRRYDLVLAIGGNPSIAHLRRALAPRGTLVFVGCENGGRWTGGFDRGLRATLLSPFVRQRLTMLVSKERHADLERLARLIDAGEVTPALDSTYPLERVPDAMRDLIGGRVRGKAVIIV